VALPAKALKVGQEDYWLDQIAPGFDVAKAEV
jgi:hypothetical protein